MSLPEDVHLVKEVHKNLRQVQERATGLLIPYSPLSEAPQNSPKTGRRKKQRSLQRQEDTPDLFLGATVISTAFLSVTIFLLTYLNHASDKCLTLLKSDAKTNKT